MQCPSLRANPGAARMTYATCPRPGISARVRVGNLQRTKKGRGREAKNPPYGVCRWRSPNIHGFMGSADE